MTPRIRIDDVLQSTNFSYWQKESLKTMDMFDWFKYTVGEHEDYPFILAVVAEGIDEQPEWVKYIKDHPHWEVQCHGWEHKTYVRMDGEAIKKELIDAKQKIYKNFGVIVDKFYPPKMKYNDMTREAARQVGLVETRERWTVYHYLKGIVPDDAKEIYCHHWNPRSVEGLWRVLAEDS